MPILEIQTMLSKDKPGTAVGAWVGSGWISLEVSE